MSEAVGSPRPDAVEPLDAGIAVADAVLDPGRIVRLEAAMLKKMPTSSSVIVSSTIRGRTPLVAAGGADPHVALLVDDPAVGPAIRPLGMELVKGHPDLREVRPGDHLDVGLVAGLDDRRQAVREGTRSAWNGSDVG